MKKLLYIDTPFIGFDAGDKNRSKFLYDSLLQTYNTDILLIEDKEYSKETILNHQIDNKIFTIKPSKKCFIKAQAIFEFNAKWLKRLDEIISKNEYDVCFLRFASTSVLADYIKKLAPKIKIIFDVDMLFSQISKAAWEQNKTFKNRYHFFEYYKLRFFENSFFNKNYNFLYTNKNERDLVLEKYNVKNIDNHFTLPNVINKIEEKESLESEENYILFYGVLNSTANLSAYNYLINEIYPLLKEYLISTKTKIYIVGKNAQEIHKRKVKNVKLIGEVENITSYIKNSKLVLFPLTVASGTLTRILEVASLKKSIVASKVASSGLDMEGKIFIANTKTELVDDIITLCQYPNLREKYEQIAYDFVQENYSYDSVRKKMCSIIDDISCKTSVVHIPRRFTKSHWGGTENVVLSIANGLKKYGIKSKILTSNILSDKKEELINNIKVQRFSYFYPYFNLAKENKKSLDLVGGNLFSWSLLYHLFFLKDVDLIHLHTAKRMGSIARTICKFRNIPYVVTIHGGLHDISASEVENRMEPLSQSFEWGKILGFLFGSRKVYDDANSIITLNKKEFEATKKNYPNKEVYLLSNSVDVKQFQIQKDESFRKRCNIPQDSFVYLSCARIDKQKNQLLTLKALKRAVKIDPEVHLLLVGNITNPAYYKELLDYISQNNLAKNVSILTDLKPNTEELVNAYLNSDAFILASRHEPFGIVGLEAWASKLPLIVSDVCGICNIIKENETALIFKDDKETALLNQMFEIKNNDILRENLIQNSLSEVLNYDEPVVNHTLCGIYHKSINLNKK